MDFLKLFSYNITMISTGIVSFELKDQDRVLVLKDALFNPKTHLYHDITIKRGWFANKFTGMTDDLAREILTSYGIVLKTLNANPGEVKLWGTLEKTHYKNKNSSGYNTSYSYGQKKDDLQLSPEDAAHYHQDKMTLHDAVRFGLWNTQNPNASSKEQIKRETVETPEPTLGSTEPCFDDLPFLLRKKRVIEHLDAKSSIPFSSFANRNYDRRINEEKFQNLLHGLRTLTLDPETEDKYAKKMRKHLSHWFQRGWKFFNEHSKPKCGYQKVLDALKDEKKAKEKYWQEHATIFWLSLIPLFAEEKLDIERLQKFLARN